jgi:beta-glucosidase
MAQPGRISDGSDASVATDHYHRYPEDVALMRELGLDAYRFSFAWPRIQPSGSGSPSKEGLAFYDRLLDELMAVGIAPMATLLHWDLPEPLQGRGGWMHRDTASRFADFALLAGESFGDRIDKWITLNEPAAVTLKGYVLGTHAPGESLMFEGLQAAHHQLLGHGMAVQALRSLAVTGGIGISNVHSPVVPARDDPLTRHYANIVDLVHNRIFADPIVLGRYPAFPSSVRAQFRPLIEVDDTDLLTIAQPIDFYGLNYYRPTRVAAGSPLDAHLPDRAPSRLNELPFHVANWPEYPQTAKGWPIAPSFLAETLRDYAERYGDQLPPVYITESGASFVDVPGENDVIIDTNRIDYIADHLSVAIVGSPGIDIRGFFVWSLVDNWEWTDGFEQRFGLVRVHAQTADRTPKASFHWLQTVLAGRR